MNARSEQGFTLVELIVTIALSTIVVSFMSVFISGPVVAYNDQVRRGELVDLANLSLQRIARDVQSALPNSLRVTNSGGNTALEILSAIDGARYRKRPPGSQDQRLRFNNSDDSFNVIGGFANVPKPFSSTSHYLSIYNVGVTGANAYELANVITPPGSQISIDADSVAGEDAVQISPAFQFAFESPSQRVFLVEGAVTYLCDLTAGTLTRFSGYSIESSQALRDSAAELIGAGAVATLMSKNVASCEMAYTPGTAQRVGLLSMRIAISEASETVSLQHQVQVVNAP